MKQIVFKNGSVIYPYRLAITLLVLVGICILAGLTKIPSKNDTIYACCVIGVPGTITIDADPAPIEFPEKSEDAKIESTDA
jgi:hypothetical protein